ncbi:MAG: YfiR family protein [Nitrospinae bacterium]|nr:YfiR family protein [Nitrospinota bacterium]
MAKRWGGAGGILALTLLLQMAAAGEARADGGLEEYRLKGAFLYHFFSFVEWPQGPLATPTLCVAGEDPFGGALDELVGRKVGGRPLAIRRILPGARPPEGCSILFIARSEESRWRDLVRSLSPGVLTVSDIERFAREGGIIEMFLQSRKVRLAVSLATARDAGLVISSRLLSLAERVDE